MRIISRTQSRREDVMQFLRSILVAGLISFSVVFPVIAGTPAEDIEAANKAFADTYNAGDAKGVAAKYTEDAALLPPDGKRVDGQDAIAAFWKGAMDGGLKNLPLTTVEVDSRDDLAFEVGAFTLDAPGEGGAMTTVAGKYIVVWKKGEDGVWRLHRDIWNSGAAE
jgi:uncharacterized protein (TIGR02246 family)